MEFLDYRSITESVGELVLQRPDKLNALSRGLLTELIEACGALRRDDELKVVIVRGDGRAFSAGFDLADAVTADATLSAYDAADLGRQATDALEAVRAVTIAAVHGHCVGGGVVLASACDLRVAADDTRWSIPEIDLGLPLTWGAVPRLVRELGPARTRELVMTGEPFTSAQAQAWGFVNRVVASDDVLAEARRLAEVLAAKPAIGLRATKQQVRMASEQMASTAHADADAVFLVAAQRDDEARAVAAAYLDGRTKRR
jgi:enoyl-CoA hydratase/carnithine racemase